MRCKETTNIAYQGGSKDPSFVFQEMLAANMVCVADIRQIFTATNITFDSIIPSG